MCKLTINLFLIVFISFDNRVFTDTTCGNWLTYKDEKCMKVFVENAQSFDDAVNTCLQNNSTLMAISSQEEQKFIENYLITQDLYDDVWVSLKYSRNKKYKWNDGSDADFTNWSDGSPINTSELCVQINSERIMLGKWSDISCLKKNLAMCEKLTTITIDLLFKMNLNLKQQLENTNKVLNSTVESLEKTNRKIDYYFSNKCVNYKTFVENNTCKALIYPFKSVQRVLGSQAIDLCTQNNATLVDTKSYENQKIVESFVQQIDTSNPDLNNVDFWIGAYSESGNLVPYREEIPFNGDINSEESACGNWVPYREEKCIKVFDTLSSFNDADGYCHQQASGSSGSGLIKIKYDDENQFVINLLKIANVANDAWIGVKYDNNSFKFSDGSEIPNTNWAEGSPKNKSDHCVQMSSDETIFGKWSDVLCTKNNLIVCEKSQVWSLAYMQKVILNTIKNPFPVGFTYVQHPLESSPREIWPWMGWSDVSDAYAGTFFRVSGGSAADFGEVQSDNSPRITTVTTGWNNHMKIAMTGICYATSDSDGGQCNQTVETGEWTPWTISGMYAGSKPNRLTRYYTSGGEVRPRNMALRIWKRVK